MRPRACFAGWAATTIGEEAHDAPGRAGPSNMSHPAGIFPLRLSKAGVTSRRAAYPPASPPICPAENEEPHRMRLTVVIPALNEADGIAAALLELQDMRREGHELILVDGGSADATVERAGGLVDTLLTAPRGRASQMNAGASVAHGDVLLFLHADTHLPKDAARFVLDEMAQSGRCWGRFDVRIAGRSPMLRLVGWMMNQRSRLTGIATGDQAMFVRRSVFLEAGGFPSIALMEDVALSARLKRRSRPVCLRSRAITSARRWERHGLLRTMALMWWLRLRFFLGTPPDVLARRYEAPPS